MSGPSPIEWTDATWNPVGGCSIASPGCGPCYAQKLAGTRLKHHPLYAGTTWIEKGRPIFNGTMTTAPDDADVWTWPLTWRGAKNPVLGAGMPSLIFVGDMSDVFHENRERAVQDKVIEAIVNSRHIGQLLTKRPKIMHAYVLGLLLDDRKLYHAEFDAAIVPRLWLGVSAERQREFDERWPYLRALAVLGFTIFISYEPAMGPLVLPDDFLALGNRAQVIAGGCSGDRAWPAHPDWFRGARDQCAGAGVAFFFKQWGEWVVKGNDDRNSPFQAVDFVRIGKKAAGRLLDGVEHNGFPAIGAAS
jgi:protein gp37